MPTQTFTHNSSADILNPGRGWQRYSSSSSAYQAETVRYRRSEGEYYWFHLHTADNTFDWSRIDNDLAAADAAGEQLSFRVYQERGEGMTPESLVPQWVVDLDPAILTPGGDINRIVDYRRRVYQQKWAQFIEALRVRYDGDDRIAYIDISGWGNFGEWTYFDADHVVDNTPSTPSDLYGHSRLYIMHLWLGGSRSTHEDASGTGVSYNFPGWQSTQLIQPDAGIRHHTAMALEYRSDVGVRTDVLGNSGLWDDRTLDGEFPAGLTQRDQVNARWLTAPVAYEMAGHVSAGDADAIASLAETHGVLVHENGDNGTATQVADLVRRAGYRYTPVDVTWDSTVAAGSSFSFASTWRNWGYAQNYPRMGQTFQVRVGLRAAGGAIAHEWNLSADTSTWLPADNVANTPPLRNASETLTVPSGLAGGDYTLTVGIFDTRLNEFINLAHTSAVHADGRTDVGTMTVSGTGGGGGGGGGGSLPEQSGRVYLVVGTGTAPNAADEWIDDQLTRLGYTVEYRDDSASMPTGADLVVISASCSGSAAPGGTYRDYPGPVVVMEAGCLDEMNMSAGTANVTEIDSLTIAIDDPSHPMAAGFSGTVTIATGTNNTTQVRHNDLGPGVALVAGNRVIFAYDVGVEGRGGFTIPARRAAWQFEVEYDTPAFNANGVALFDAAVVWATGSASTASAPLDGASASTSAASGDLTVNGMVLLSGASSSASAVAGALIGGVAKLDPLTPAAMPSSRAERILLIEADRVDVSVRVEVLDENDDVLGEIDVDNIIIRHDAEAAIHRSVELTTKDELEWSWQRVRPFVTVETREFIEERPMGVFLLADPRQSIDSPPTYEISGYDKLYALDQKLTAPVSLPEGQPILLSVREILAQHGMPLDRIDDSRGGDTLSEARVWGIEFEGTALTVINDLLNMVGYDNLSIDEWGQPEAGPKIAADKRPVMWRYDAQSPTGITLVDSRSLTTDFTNAPNQWQFWSADVERDDAPVEGDGLYIVNNVDDGPSSQSARRGLIIRSDNDGPIEASSQADLETNGDAIVAQEIQAITTYAWATDVNPYHRHRDVVECVDRDLGVAGPFTHMSWEMDVLGRQMSHVGHKVTGGIVNA